ncbi:MAG: single-stranded DNA-binding protein [Candidatus Electryoneaceae bacterium]|nr:single-stranded DNA-binding protein [Candidatus Electryoneaceae bacterium]
MADLKMPDINNVIIVGNLIKDPVVRHTTNGTPVANFTIASNRKFKDNFGQWKEDVCFIGIVAWYKLAESCAENLRKGSAVLVEGELQSRQLRSDDGRYRNVVEIKARRIQFLNKREMVLSDMETGTRTSVHPSAGGATGDSEWTSSSQASDVAKDDDKKVEESQSSDEDESDDDSTFDFGFRELKL